MRIALISLHTSPGAVPGSGDAGGMNVVAAEAAHALADRGHDVTLVTRASADLPAGEHAFARHHSPSSNEFAVDRGKLSLVALAAGPAELRKEQLPGVIPEFAAGLRSLGPFDAVHAHYWLSGVASLEALQGSDQVPAVTFHTLAAQKNALLAAGDTPEPAHRVEAEQNLVHRGFVIAGSHSEFDAVETFCGVPPHGSEIVHPGVNTTLFRPAEPGAHAGALFRITVLGRVQPLKGQDLAVRAFGELAQLDGSLAARAELVIAGEPTPGAERYAAHLRELATQYGVDDRVQFFPAQTRVESAALLASSALVLVPSHSETFGLTALEAGASGVPVIVGGHTGLVESAPANVAGVHMADREPRHWAEAIAALLRDPHRRNALGASARAHALTHDWSVHAERLERIYAGLAK